MGKDSDSCNKLSVIMIEIWSSKIFFFLIKKQYHCMPVPLITENGNDCERVYNCKKCWSEKVRNVWMLSGCDKMVFMEQMCLNGSACQASLSIPPYFMSDSTVRKDSTTLRGRIVILSFSASLMIGKAKKVGVSEVWKKKNWTMNVGLIILFQCWFCFELMNL